MTTHLVIGDAHVDCDVPNTRFEWLGNLIVDRLPDVIIQMGDWADMKSLCSYDKGKKDFEGRKYERDINAANEALDIVETAIRRYNDNARKSKKALYRPRKVALGGNHDEGRISKLVSLHPEFEGVFGIEQIQFREHGWEYVPYEIPIGIDGVFYCHTFPTGVSGEAVSGVNVAQSLVSKNLVSSSVGHNHCLDIANRSTPDGRRVWGLSAGCFFDHKMQYAKAVQDRFWWSGVIMKKGVLDGDYSPEVISMRELRHSYG